MYSVILCDFCAFWLVLSLWSPDCTADLSKQWPMAVTISGFSITSQSWWGTWGTCKWHWLETTVLYQQTPAAGDES